MFAKIRVVHCLTHMLQVKADSEGEFIIRSIIGYILKSICEKASKEDKKEDVESMAEDNFRDKILNERMENRILTLIGEDKSGNLKREYSETEKI